MPQLYLRGQDLGEINCIIFDKDGTLINTERGLLDIAKLRIEKTIKIMNFLKYGKDKIEDTKRNLEKIYGLNNQSIAPEGAMAIASREQNLISTATIISITGITWSKALQISSDAFDLVDLITQEKNAKENNQVNLPGSISLIKGLKKKGFILGIITNDNKAGLNNYLFKNDLNNCFNHCFSSEDLPPKPNPKAIENLCKVLNVKSSQCALISDSDLDLLMAKESKIKIILGYTGGWSIPPKLYEHDHLIHRWNEITYQ